MRWCTQRVVRSLIHPRALKKNMQGVRGEGRRCSDHTRQGAVGVGISAARCSEAVWAPARRVCNGAPALRVMRMLPSSDPFWSS